jgi:hypothetical protein
VDIAIERLDDVLIFDLGSAVPRHPGPKFSDTGSELRQPITEIQLQTLKPVGDILTVHFNFSVASFCPALLPYADRIRLKGL